MNCAANIVVLDWIMCSVQHFIGWTVETLVETLQKVDTGQVLVQSNNFGGTLTHIHGALFISLSFHLSVWLTHLSNIRRNLTNYKAEAKVRRTVFWKKFSY